METKTKGTALITGASAGIGAVYADRLARRGYDLILVARSQERLELLAAELSQKTGLRVDAVAADLTDLAAVTEVQEILRTNSQITMLINNAGIGGTSPLLGSDITKLSQMIILNADTMTRLTWAVAPAFVERGAGTIINVASIVAVRPELLGGVYGGTKAFVLAFSESLKHELTGTGVRIQVVLPGATATNFWELAGTPVKHLRPEIVMQVDELVDAALAGLDQGEFVTIPSLPDPADWDAYESARQALFPNLSRSSAAPRYRLPSRLPR